MKWIATLALTLALLGCRTTVSTPPPPKPMPAHPTTPGELTTALDSLEAILVDCQVSDSI